MVTTHTYRKWYVLARESHLLKGAAEIQDKNLTLNMFHSSIYTHPLFASEPGPVNKELCQRILLRKGSIRISPYPLFHFYAKCILYNRWSIAQ